MATPDVKSPNSGALMIVERQSTLPLALQAGALRSRRDINDKDCYHLHPTFMNNLPVQ